MNTVQVFGDKSDGERFGKALALLEEARAAFRSAGSEVERERDGVLGNLYAVIRAEEERSQRVAKYASRGLDARTPAAYSALIPCAASIPVCTGWCA